LAPDSNQLVNVTDKIEIAEYGILVPVKNSQLLAEAMELLVKNKNLRDHLHEKSLERSKDFESGKIIEQYTQVVESTLSKTNN
jgi:N-acetylgalactosamine-N,N'-diacetylbacillosaminyl-diphospho-undecaprenol 4-alpha-N-acetylgalactosaminyltransferase